MGIFSQRDENKPQFEPQHRISSEQLSLNLLKFPDDIFNQLGYLVPDPDSTYAKGCCPVNPPAGCSALVRAGTFRCSPPARSNVQRGAVLCVFLCQPKMVYLCPGSPKTINKKNVFTKNYF